jgi:hypothetical protein
LAIKPVHQRIAELWTIQAARKLTELEDQEMTNCMIINANYCWKMAHLENQSLLASMTSDIDWQHEVCVHIEQLTS